MAYQIQLKGEFRHEEAEAAGIIKPGMLIELLTAGTVQAHSTRGGFAERAFAVEDALQGHTIDNSYAVADLVTYHLVVPGGEVMALIQAGCVVTVGEQLISGADGTLIPIGDIGSHDTLRQVVAVATEAIDLSDSGDDDALCEVRVL